MGRQSLSRLEVEKNYIGKVAKKVICLKTSRRYFSNNPLFICKQRERERGESERKMVLLDKLWDDVAAGPQPERGLGKLRKLFTPNPLTIKEGEGESSSKNQRSLSVPSTPGTPTTPVTPNTPSPTAARKENVWRSVFHPGSNLATRHIGADVFDKPQPNSPTVYDWLYSGETRSKHHR